MECPCLIPDEHDNCVDCGKRIDLPEAPASLNLGDIPGIVRLLDATASTYLRLVEANTDPRNPALPRLQMAGGMLVRVPHRSLLRKILKPSYVAAKTLGYRGTFERWGEMVEEALRPLPKTPDPC